ncbi:hypothetical protein [Streptomyces sp. B6B3]|uniref:hypothetical protein n=1 Tax=Streptomyces sp. B6B3 TaxID=3153570 RepID=UPI00325EE0F3
MAEQRPEGSGARLSVGGQHNSGVLHNLGVVVNNFFGLLAGKRWPWLPLTLAVAASAVAVTVRPESSTSQGVRCALLFVAAVVLGAWRYFLPLLVPGEGGEGRAGGGGSPRPSPLGRLFRRREPLGQILSVGALLLGLCGWLVLQHLVDHGDLDVTGQFRFEGSQPLKDGETVTATARPEETRDRLLFTLDLTDDDPRLGTCVPTATASVVLTAGEGPAAREVEVATGEEAEIPLGGARTTLGLDITLHADVGCLMDVAISSATLRD